MRPGGRKPLSGLTSHSYPSVPVPGARVSVWPEFRVETAVFRQKRSLAKVPGTLMSDGPELTRKYWPLRLFSGRPASPGGLKRGSRQVPVVTLGPCGSTGVGKWVSL